MLYVFLSVCCNVMVSVLLKLARRYHIDIFQAIAWNYSVAMVLTWVLYTPKFESIDTDPVYIYGSLAVLLPALFVVIGLSIKATGIVRTDIAERLSLFIPIIAAFLLFNENLTILKLAGLSIGIIAIIFSIPWKKERSYNRRSAYAWLYLVTVFVGMGLIDVLFKQVALYNAVPYTTSLFIIYTAAFVLSQITLLFMVMAGKIKFTLRHIFFGWILGVVNFGNILFYLKAHQALSGNPSVVFSAMNIGVIVLGTLIGLFIFREKLSKLNKAGIVLAIIAIIIMAYSQTH